MTIFGGLGCLIGSTGASSSEWNGVSPVDVTVASGAVCKLKRCSVIKVIYIGEKGNEKLSYMKINLRKLRKFKLFVYSHQIFWNFEY